MSKQSVEFVGSLYIGIGVPIPDLLRQWPSEFSSGLGRSQMEVENVEQE